LQHAKVFVSIYGTEEARAETMEGLKAATGYVRSELGQRMRLRRTPEVRFVEDRSLEEGSQVIDLINRLSREREAAAVASPGDENDDTVGSDEFDAED
jgi:ribosome-binding factor A